MKPERLGHFCAALAALVFSAFAHAAGPTGDQPIVLDTASGQVSGSLVMPAARGPVPVALIIAGSGPTDRNGNSAMLPGANNSLLLLAQALGEAGFASVRYDKRGVGASTLTVAQKKDVRFESFIDDAAGWIARLRRDPRFSSVTVIGHSEGSLIGMVAADKAGANAFVSVAGAGRPAAAIMRSQLAAKLPADLAAQNETILAGLEHGRTTSPVPPALQALYPESVQPYLVSWFKYDPAQRIAALRVPVLIAQGTTDIQVAVSEAELLKAARPDARLVLVPGMNHVLKIVDAAMPAQLASYSDPQLPVAPALIGEVVEFMRGVSPKN